MKVLKFGGTSVGTIDSLRNVKSIVESIGEPAIVVVSALGGLTDRLIATARMAASGERNLSAEIDAMEKRHADIIESLVAEDRRNAVMESVGKYLAEMRDVYKGISLIRDLPEKTLDVIVSFGERMSSLIVANIIDNAGHCDSLDFIKTEKWFNKNIADRALSEDLIRRTFGCKLDCTMVCGGFISRDRDSDEITNLGRGGSDYTAALIAAALDADLLEIWTDVDGFMTSDPRVIPTARVIPRMSFIESMELCSFGAKVIYPPTIYPVFHKNIPIRILNTNNHGAPGTLIDDSVNEIDGSVRGVSSLRQISMVTVTGDLTSNVAQINSRTFNAMARGGISVFLVSQPDNDLSFSVTMPESEMESAMAALHTEFAPELQSGEVLEIEARSGLAVIAVVRESIRKIKGLGPRLVNTLHRNGIEVTAVSDGTSETTIALVVDCGEVNKAMELVHGACFSEPLDIQLR